MASGITVNSNTCSICFEKFKTPRYLPCTHSFCQGCLSSYIVSLCTSTEPRLGFNCPLCRKYIPCVGDTDMPEEWAGLFPMNDVLEKVLVNSEETFCQACLRESEKEDAKDFCLNCMEYLCIMCTKYHKRGLTTRDHKIIAVNELKNTNLAPNAVRRNTCLKHQDRKIELFCADHEEPCCTMCVSMEHRECESVDTVAKIAENLRELLSENDTLLEDVQILENKLSDAKKEQETFVTELNDRADRCTESTEKEFSDAVHHLECLKNEYLAKMSTVFKENKEKYEKCIETLADGIQCAGFCTQNFEEARKGDNDAEFVIKYYKGKKIFDRVKNYKFTQMHIEIEETKPDILEEIMEIRDLPEASVSESEIDVMSDLRRVQLSKIIAFRIDDACVRDGTFLGNGQFILSTRKHQRNTYDDKCCVYDKKWESKKVPVLGTLSTPFGLIQKEKELLFVACTSSKVIAVLSLNSFSIVRRIPISMQAFGIAQLRNYLYLACENKVLKVNQSGGKIKEYSTGSGVRYILASGFHIVYSNRNKNEVIAMTDLGSTIWTYSSPQLISPCGLDRDTDGNIYVAGKDSDNVHVLSKDGKLIRIFEDIPRPDFMKVNEDRNTCCVCSNRKHISVYEFK